MNHTRIQPRVRVHFYGSLLLRISCSTFNRKPKCVYARARLKSKISSVFLYTSIQNTYPSDKRRQHKKVPVVDFYVNNHNVANCIPYCIGSDCMYIITTAHFLLPSVISKR